MGAGWVLDTAKTLHVPHRASCAWSNMSKSFFWPKGGREGRQRERDHIEFPFSPFGPVGAPIEIRIKGPETWETLSTSTLPAVVRREPFSAAVHGSQLFCTPLVTGHWRALIKGPLAQTLGLICDPICYSKNVVPSSTSVRQQMCKHRETRARKWMQQMCGETDVDRLGIWKVPEIFGLGGRGTGGLGEGTACGWQCGPNTASGSPMLQCTWLVSQSSPWAAFMKNHSCFLCNRS